MNLKNKVIIVTGGSGLLGKAIVDNINLKGGIAINADITHKTDLKNNLLFFDITNENSIINGIKLVLNHFGKICGLVNNAYPRTEDWGNKFENISSVSWKKNIDMQLNSHFLCCQKTLEIMEKQGYGSIVNIASIYGIVGNDFTLYEDYDGTSPAAYSAIKGGIINFTRYLASYFAKNNIRVNCVSPGGIKDNQPLSFINKYEKKVPIGRMAVPSDISPGISFLLSDESKYITGHNLIIDGGWTAI